MDCIPSIHGAVNAVSVVHWTATATDGQFTSGDAGITQIARYIDGPFIAYSDLTESQVMEWVFLALGSRRSAIEAGLLASIASQSEPPLVTLRPPW